MILTELDCKEDIKKGVWAPRPEPRGSCQDLQIEGAKEQVTSIGAYLDEGTREILSSFLKENVDVFAWKPIGMPSINPNFFCHKLALNPSVKPLCQRRMKMALEQLEIEKQVKELQEVGFIREIRYTTWLANVVLVKKQNEKWRMCFDYTNLNKHCPKILIPAS